MLRQHLPKAWQRCGIAYPQPTRRYGSNGQHAGMAIAKGWEDYRWEPNMHPLHNKIALVTGAASGLGAAIAKQLVGAGARVALADLPSGQGGKVGKVALCSDGWGTATMSLHFDVSKPAEVAEAMAALQAQWGGLDILVNNAGTDHTASIDEIGEQEWRRVVDTNLYGPFLLTKAALPLLRQSDAGRGGHIVNVASTASLRAWPNASAYHASKWGLRGLSEAMHTELRALGIRVTTLFAGGMRTPFLLERFPDIDQTLLQDPDNVASMVQFLLGMPRGSVVAEVMVLPDQETSWP